MVSASKRSRPLAGSALRFGARQMSLTVRVHGSVAGPRPAMASVSQRNRALAGSAFGFGARQTPSPVSVMPYFLSAVSTASIIFFASPNSICVLGL